MEILISVASKIAEYTVAPIGRQVGYLFSYKHNFKELIDQVEELEIARADIKSLVEAEKRKGKEIFVVVKDWLDKVNETIDKAKQLCEDPHREMVGCTKYPFANLWQRHRLSRKAKKLTNHVADVKGKGKFEGDQIGYFPALSGVGSTSATCRFVNFESRMSIMDEIMQALTDPKISILGVYGFGGVGKSTLVEQVARKAKLNDMFDEVVMASVTQSPDLKRIQDEIKDQLGLQFIEDSVVGRAHRLRERINQGKNILIILDDIRATIKLEDIGIPFRGNMNLEERKLPSRDDHKRCKILLTSRNQDLLHEMETQKNFRLEVLSEKEAWNLFEVMAGDIAKDSTYEGIASEVAKKCAGLPVLIVTVARALKNKGIPVWKNFLSKLARVDNKELHELTYSALELSYNQLEGDEIKALFLLCGVIPFDAVEYLLKCVLGLGIFKHVNTIEDARTKLYTAISALKASCLLLDDGDTSMEFEMHDTIRDVAISIASRDEFVFTRKQNFELKEWPTKDFLKRCSKIILFECNIQKLPERLDCPELECLLLGGNVNRSLEIPDSFFEGMGKLKVLDISCMDISSLPTSVRNLTELQTLCLDQCVLGDIAIIGALKNLKVLSFHSSTVELPSEIGKLTNLRMLDMSHSRIAVIPPNIISSLTALEELCMGDASIEWEVSNSANQSKNASLAELRQLPNLSALDVHIGEVWNLPRDIMFDKLERYKILIGDVWEWADNYRTSKTLKLKLRTSIHLEHGIKELIKRVESLCMDEINGISNVLYELNAEGFPLLKNLHIQNNEQIQHIINSIEWNQAYDSFPSLETLELENLVKLEKLFHGPLAVNSLSKLKVIKVQSCDQLKYLFSYSLVKMLSQLINIEVSECSSMQSIVFTENDSGIVDNDITDTIEFCRLQSLTLQNLPMLDGFFSNEFTKQKDKQQATCVSDPFFSTKVAFPKLETIELSSIDMDKIWDDGQLSASCGIQNLTSLIVKNCGDLKYLFSYSMSGSLSNLKQLEISKCHMMEEIITLKEEGRRNRTTALDEVGFAKLEKIMIEDMEKLKTIWHHQFDGVKSIEIKKCEKLVCIFPSSVQRKFLCLETLIVKDCNSVKEIFELNANEVGFDASITKLGNLTLIRLPNLQQIWSMEPEGILSFYNLQVVHVESCDNLKYLFPLSVATRLEQLDTLRVEYCNYMTEVVANNGGHTKGLVRFVLNQLTTLTLWGLTRLRGFYARNHTLYCPSLKKVYVIGSNKLDLFETQSASSQERDDDGKLHVSLQQPLFTAEEVIPNLEILTLNGKDASTILQGGFSLQLMNKLKVLWVSRFEDEQATFPYWFLQKAPNLESLTIRDSFFKKIFQDERFVSDFEQSGFRIKLKVLWLVRLPKLRYICKEGSKVDPILEVLKELHVDDCSNLRNLLPSSVTFSSLKILEVENCNGLINLITSATTRSLVKLKSMKIKECNALEEIMKEEGYETFEDITFNSLELLELIDLPQLSRFCSSNYLIKFPLLSRVVVRQCPRMKIFSQGDTITPKLRKVQVEEENNTEWFWEHNLNGTIKNMFSNKTLELSSINLDKIWDDGQLSATCGIQILTSLIVKDCGNLKYLFSHSMTESLSNLRQLEISKCHMMEEIITVKEEGRGNRTAAVEEVGFAKLEKIMIEDMEKLKTVWHRQFDRVKSIEIKKCEKLVCVFPSSVQRKFLCLETLIVNDCNSVKEIFELNANEVGFDLSITKLGNLILEELPKLEQIWSMEPEGILSFYNLQIVQVKSCDNLKYLFPLSVATGLEKLDTVRVKYCEYMTEVVANNEGHAKGLVRFVLNQLTTLILQNLTRLRGFYARNHTLYCPSLKNVKVISCYKLVLFETQSKTFEERDDDGKLHVSPQQPLFTAKEVIPNLEIMTLIGKDASTILQGGFSLQLMNKLKELWVSRFEGEQATFPYWFLKNLPNLESLTIGDSFFKKIFQDERFVSDLEQSGFRIKLKVLWLVRLPKLRYIYKEGSKVDPILEVLKELHVVHCSNLRDLLPSSVTFSSLKFLEVKNCNGLMNLITSATTRSLVKLKSMKIKECNALEEIMKEEGCETFEDITFNSLELLELIDLPQLSRFCSSNYLIKFPLLSRVVVRQCPRMKIFSQGDTITPKLHKVQVEEENNTEWFWEHNLNGTIKNMFSNKVAFHSFKHLKLSEFPELKELWYGQIQNDVFNNLKSVVVHECDFLSDVLFTSNMLQLVQNLEELEVKDCRSIEAVFDVKGTMDKEVQVKQTTQLKKLTLSGLPKLKQIWTEGTSEILSFRNFCEMDVDGCESLKTMFSMSLCHDLGHLKKLHIRQCGVLEEIVAKEEGLTECMFSFPQLTAIQLWNLEKLRNFYPEKHTLECPSLKILHVYHCEVLQTFTFEHLEFQQLHQVDEIDIPTQQALFSVEKVFPSLELLALNNNDVWTLQNSHHQENLFHNINHLILQCFHEAQSVFPNDFLQRFPHLDMLEVHCSSFQTLFPLEEKGHHDAGTILQVENLVLDELDQLKYIWEECFLTNPRMQEVDSSQTLMSLKNLTILKVDQCKELLCIFTSAIAKSLGQLRELRITNCEMIEDVVHTLEEEAEEEITFENLEYLELSSLSRFRGFSFGKHNFLFPSLMSLKVTECPKMMLFSFGKIVAPTLRVVEVEKERKRWQDDLNTTIQQLFIDKVIHNENGLKVDCKDAMIICNGQFPANLFHNVKALTLECFQEQFAFPANFLERFTNLEKLEICDSWFKTILLCQRKDDDGSRMSSKIKHLSLGSLSQLKYIWDCESQLDSLVRNLESLEIVGCSSLKKLAPPSVSFQNLTTLVVDQCHGLFILVTSSTAKSFVQLTAMRIHNCKMMGEIVADEGDESEDEISFNCLASLELTNLESLKSFCSKNFTFNFPSLERVIVKNCPKMVAFCPGVLITPILKVVETEEGDAWEDNLNTTIQHLSVQMDIPEVHCEDIPELEYDDTPEI